VYEIGITPNFKFEFCNYTSLFAMGTEQLLPNFLKNWKLSTVKLRRKHTDVYGSATKCKTGSGRLKTARTAENVERVAQLICSQEDDPGTSKSTK